MLASKTILTAKTGQSLTPSNEVPNSQVVLDTLFYSSTHRSDNRSVSRLPGSMEGTGQLWPASGPPCGVDSIFCNDTCHGRESLSTCPSLNPTPLEVTPASDVVSTGRAEHFWLAISANPFWYWLALTLFCIAFRDVILNKMCAALQNSTSKEIFRFVSDCAGIVSIMRLTKLCEKKLCKILDLRAVVENVLLLFQRILLCL